MSARSERPYFLVRCFDHKERGRLAWWERYDGDPHTQPLKPVERMAGGLRPYLQVVAEVRAMTDFFSIELSRDADVLYLEE
jgi:hypothetical protein